jgi:hypothetical protein
VAFLFSVDHGTIAIGVLVNIAALIVLGILVIGTISGLFRESEERQAEKFAEIKTEMRDAYRRMFERQNGFEARRKIDDGTSDCPGCVEARKTPRPYERPIPPMKGHY